MLTDWAEIAAQVRQDTVTLELPPVAEPTRRALESGDRCWQGSEIVVGVPHLVLPVSNLDDLAIDTVAPPLRSHPALGPEGANVHFVDHMEDGELAFDYTLRDGPVQRGNALALMRSVGLEV